MQMLGLVSNHKILCVTHTTTTTRLIKQTLQSSTNAESTNICGWQCPCLENDDTATVMTMQMQATRIDLLLAPSGG
jgi:hypothetical protein